MYDRLRGIVFVPRAIALSAADDQVIDSLGRQLSRFLRLQREGQETARSTRLLKLLSGKCLIGFSQGRDGEFGWR